MSAIKKVKEVTDKAKTCVVHGGPDTYQVTSPSGRLYFVRLLEKNGATCNCPWGEHRPPGDPRSACSHVLAVTCHRLQTRGYRVRVYGKADEGKVKRARRHTEDLGDVLVVGRR